MFLILVKEEVSLEEEVTNKNKGDKDDGVK